MQIDWYKPFFAVYVVWHPKFEKGKEIADFLYIHFTRNIQDQIHYRSPSIPVFYRSEISKEAQVPPPITPDEAKNLAVVCLVDDEWVVDDIWGDYLNEFCKNANSSIRLYPVAVSQNALSLYGEISEVNFIRLYNEFDDKSNAEKVLLRTLTHEFTRQLLAVETGAIIEKVEPIKLFLSHSKTDGVKIAEELKEFIHKNTALKTFFDATDIPSGTTFGKFILGNINQCAVIVLQTDEFSSRPWCQRELLSAKKAKVPIIVVNALLKGEKRSFPYLGNLPTIRLNEQQKYDDIIDLALSEFLRCVHIRLHFTNFIRSCGLEEDRVQVLTNCPELLDVHNFIQQQKEHTIDQTIFLYPDPPLGYEEITILNENQDSYMFITPTLLASRSHVANAGVKTDEKEKPFEHVVIGMSISESPDAKSLGFSSRHLHDTLVEFSRYFIVNGAKLVYGGDLRRTGFSETLYELFDNYNPDSIEPSQKLINYLSWPIYLKREVKKHADLKRIVKFIDVDLPHGLGVDAKVYIEPDTTLHKYIWAQSISKMRNEMNQIINVRVLLGGQTTNFLSVYPGIIEEAYLAMSSGMPTFLIGAFGGAAKVVSDALKGHRSPIMYKEYHMRNSQYKNMVDDYGADLDYEGLYEFFRKVGVSGLNNGLSEEENLRLFETIHVQEMITLVLKGLGNCLSDGGVIENNASSLHVI